MIYQCLSYSHALMIRMDGNGSQDKHINIFLEGQSAEEYSTKNLFPIHSHKTIQIPTIGTGNQFLHQVTDQRPLLFTLRFGKQGNKETFNGL